MEWNVLWLVALLATTLLVGFTLALAIFFIVFLRIRAGLDWLRCLLLTGAGLGALLLIAGTLNRDFPPGLLQEFFDLPWPFR